MLRKSLEAPTGPRVGLGKAAEVGAACSREEGGRDVPVRLRGCDNEGPELRAKLCVQNASR